MQVTHPGSIRRCRRARALDRAAAMFTVLLGGVSFQYALEMLSTMDCFHMTVKCTLGELNTKNQRRAERKPQPAGEHLGKTTFTPLIHLKDPPLWGELR